MDAIRSLTREAYIRDQDERAASDARGAQESRRLRRRRRAGVRWQAVFVAATAGTILILSVLLASIVNDAFGYVAVAYERPPESLTTAGTSLDELSAAELTGILEAHVSAGLMRRLEHDKPFARRSKEEILSLIGERVTNPHIVKSWPLADSLFHAASVRDAVAAMEGARLEFRAWLTPAFITRPQASVAGLAGVRTAILGSLWIGAITILFAVPLGVGTALYLEEYAPDTRIARLVQVNIYNLAGIPSIVYGLLGLAVFVRFLGPVTSGAVFGAAGGSASNGRTILSAGLTLALLVLPIIVITSQEAIRAVPSTLRQSSYGLGATKWQTVRSHVLPVAFPRILTGVILAISRAIGETAPLVVVGASTFVAIDPGSPFSKFTTLPIQIYQWTARPQAEFRNAAAAAIIVLLALLLTMNSAAIILRNRYGKERRIG